jgi:hypothetical protein
MASESLASGRAAVVLTLEFYNSKKYYSAGPDFWIALSLSMVLQV